MEVQVFVAKLEGWGNLAQSEIAEKYASKAQNEKLPLESRLENLATGLLLARVLGVTHNNQLITQQNGKPALANGNAQISISHGGTYVALAVASPQVGPIGVDIEPIKKYNCYAAKRVLTPKDIAHIESAATKEEQALRFAFAWTRLEAILKADGCGFCQDPRSEGVPQGWSVAHSQIDAHIVAVAARTTPTIKLERIAL